MGLFFKGQRLRVLEFRLIRCGLDQGGVLVWIFSVFGDKACFFFEFQVFDVRNREFVTQSCYRDEISKCKNGRYRSVFSDADFEILRFGEWGVQRGRFSQGRGISRMGQREVGVRFRFIEGFGCFYGSCRVEVVFLSYFFQRWGGRGGMFFRGLVFGRRFDLDKVVVFSGGQFLGVGFQLGVVGFSVVREIFRWFLQYLEKRYLIFGWV